jgi:hypothetical protein
MTFLFVTMSNLSQNNYVYDEFYDDVLIYHEKCSSLKFSRKHNQLTNYKIMMFYL